MQLDVGEMAGDLSSKGKRGLGIPIGCAAAGWKNGSKKFTSDRGRIQRNLRKDGTDRETRASSNAKQTSLLLFVAQSIGHLPTPAPTISLRMYGEDWRDPLATDTEVRHLLP